MMQLLYLFAIILQVYCTITNQIKLVYQTLPNKTINLGDKDGIITNFKIAQSADILCVSTGFRGVVIIDALTFNIMYETTVKGEFLSSVGVTSDAKYLFFTFQNKLRVFLFKDRKSLEEQSHAELSGGDAIDILVSDDDRLVFVASEFGIVSVFDIALDGQQIKLIDSISTGSNIINRMTFSLDRQWLFLGDNEKGFTLVKVHRGKDPGDVKMHKVANGVAYWKIFQCAATVDLLYVYCSDFWDGIYIASLRDIIISVGQAEQKALLTGLPQEIVPITFKKRAWPLQDLNPNVFSLALGWSDAFLIVAVRSLGLFLFDISNRENPVFYQRIPIEGQPVQLYLVESGDKTKIFFANKVSISTFVNVVPNLNNDYPNLFNGHQSKVTQFYSNIFYKWRCYVNPQNSYFYGTQDYLGMAIVQIVNNNPYDLRLQTLIENVKPTLTASASFSDNYKYMYLGVQEGLCTLHKYDISSGQAVSVGCLTSSIPSQHVEDQAMSKDETLLALSYDNGVLLVDVVNFKILSFWQVSQQMMGDQAGVMITHDNSWLLGTVRGFGLFVLDISNPSLPVFKSMVNTQGGEMIKASAVFSNYAYLVDGYNGIAVINLASLPEIEFTSRVQLKGWSNDVYAVGIREDYLLVSTMDDGQLTLVDARDKTNLYIVSMFQEGNQSSMSLCATSDSLYVFLNNEFGVRVMPLFSLVFLHAEMQILSGDTPQQQVYTSLSKETVFQVGQFIRINLVPLYMKNGMIFEDITYYPGTTMKVVSSLPSWMTFSNSNSKLSLFLQITKESISSGLTAKAVDNILLVKTAVPLVPSDFIFNASTDGVTTTLVQSVEIFQEMQSKMYINTRGYVTSLLDESVELSLSKIVSLSSPEEMSRLNTAVKRALLITIQFNPVMFRVEGSFTFSKNTVTTLSKSVQIILVFPQQRNDSMLRFVNVSYTGCIQEFGNDRASLILTSSNSGINKILASKIYFFSPLLFENGSVSPISPDLSSINPSSSLAGETLFVTFQDSLNFNLDKQFTLSEALSFIQPISPIIVLSQNSAKNLETQFANIFDQSEIYIETDINFSFDPKSFTQAQSNIIPLTYTLQYLSGDIYVEASSGYWLHLEPNSLKFYGFVQSSQNLLYTTAFLRVLATNGYQTVSETFTININKVPLSIILNLVLRVLGPLLGLLGLYKFKNHILNAIYWRRTMFSDEQAIANKLFYKQIMILGNDFELAKILFHKFLVLQTPKISRPNDNKTFPPTHIRDILSPMANNQISKKFISYTSIIHNIGPQNKKDSDKLLEKRARTLSQAFKQEPSEQKLNIQTNNLGQNIPAHQQESDNFREKYVKSDGVLDMDHMINDIVESNIAFTYSNQRYSTRSLLPVLNNPKSVFYNCMKAVASMHLLTLNKRALLLFQYLKQKSIATSLYTENDWYRHYVEINYLISNPNNIPGFNDFTEQDDERISVFTSSAVAKLQNLSNPVAECQIREDVIIDILFQLGIFQDKGSTFSSMSNHGINHHLLQEVLFAEARGFVSMQSYFIQQSAGESMHILPQSIKKIQASRVIQTPCCFSLGSQDKFVPFSLQMLLPQWLSASVIHNMLVLKGIPKPTDEPTIIIRIFNQQNLIIQEQIHPTIISPSNIITLKKRNPFFADYSRNMTNNVVVADQVQMWKKINKSIKKKKYNNQHPNRHQEQGMNEKFPESIDSRLFFNNQVISPTLSVNLFKESEEPEESSLNTFNQDRLLKYIQQYPTKIQDQTVSKSNQREFQETYCSGINPIHLSQREYHFFPPFIPNKNANKIPFKTPSRRSSYSELNNNQIYFHNSH